MIKTRDGYRGYIGSRPYFESRTPQHVQNLVIRDYCQRRGLRYLLSATEYAMPGCFVMLENVLKELPVLEGIVLYSLFMLPPAAERRRAIYRLALDAGASLHAALEDIAVADTAAAAAVEDLWLVNQALPHCPKLPAEAMR